MNIVHVCDRSKYVILFFGKMNNNDCYDNDTEMLMMIITMIIMIREERYNDNNYVGHFLSFGICEIWQCSHFIIPPNLLTYRGKVEGECHQSALSS